MMPVRRLDKDPRTEEEKQADEEALELFERGEFLHVDPAREREAIDYVRRMNRERREIAARLAKMFGEVRQGLGVSQEEVARGMGTQKSFISRVESGRYGGLTLERFLALFDALHLAVAGSALFPLFSGSHPRRVARVHHEELDRFRSPAKCLE